MQEIEAKFYVSKLDLIRMRLQSLEALLIQERVLETNIRFDLPDGGLASEGRVLRLRQDTEAKLTYKGPSTTEHGILNHVEIEFTVQDHEKAKLLVEALGYQRVFYYEKFRTTYQLEDCHVMLDELPIGRFVEIEGEGVESIQKLAVKLGLDIGASIPTSYLILFKTYCQKHPNIDSTDLSFTALHDISVSADDLSIRAADA